MASRGEIRALVGRKIGEAEARNLEGEDLYEVLEGREDGVQKVIGPVLVSPPDDCQGMGDGFPVLQGERLV